MQRTIPSLLGLLVLLSGLGLGVSLVQQSQDVRSRATGESFLSSTGANRAAQLAAEIAEQVSSEQVRYMSEDYGYEVVFDPDYWTPTAPGTGFGETTFTLNSAHGLATVTIVPSEEGKLAEIASAGEIGTGDALDLVVENYEKTRVVPLATVYKGKDLSSRNGNPEYRLTYTSSYLGEETQFRQYLTLRNDFYYVIEAKYSTLNGAGVLAENFIDSIEYFRESVSSVKGATTSNAGLEILDEAKIVELAKPSVVNIISIYCNTIEIPDTSGARYLKESYEYCSGSKGSGFFVNSSGYVATNGHVVKTFPESSLISGIANRSIKQFPQDLVAELMFLQLGLEVTSEQAATALSQVYSNPQSLDSLLELLYTLLDKEFLVITEGEGKHFVKLSGDPIRFDQGKIDSGDVLNAVLVSNTVVEAEVVDFDYPNKFSVDAILRGQIPHGSDVALIKLKNVGGLVFPSLTLGSLEDVVEGSQLLVIGYPGLVEGSGDPLSLISEESSALSTVTRGIVSSIKTDQGGNKLVQTDASIDHGNSGGPALDQYGRVIGIATYGFESQSGNYNFMRDVADLKVLVDKNGLSTTSSSTFENWLSGLEFFWGDYFRRSIEPFSEVQAAYEIHPTVDSYIADANAAIENGEDAGGFLGRFGIYLDSTSYVYIFGGALVVGILGLVVSFVKKKKQPRQPVQSSRAQANPETNPTIRPVSQTHSASAVPTQQPQQAISNYQVRSKSSSGI